MGQEQSMGWPQTVSMPHWPAGQTGAHCRSAPSRSSLPRSLPPAPTAMSRRAQPADSVTLPCPLPTTAPAEVAVSMTVTACPLG